MRKMIILGATSGIAIEVARAAARHGDEIYLVARNEVRLQDLVSDLTLRGAKKVGYAVQDLDQIAAHSSLLDQATAFLGGLDTALIAHGVLPEQAAAEKDFSLVEKTFHTNFTSAASLSELLTQRFESQRNGTLAVIGSVAGDRGRQSNYIYGSSKAALHAYLAGLRNRAFKSGVTVITIKPGFVDTPMTAHLPKGPLFASAEKVGRGIYRAIQFKCKIVYLPMIWRLIMHIIRHIPENVFVRMKL